uniref:Uncharacterized protein n=1 Tax=Rhizophora mucronata TaxID=61149 RepID=A0A2P2R1B1_RHIMU
MIINLKCLGHMLLLTSWLDCVCFFILPIEV